MPASGFFTKAVDQASPQTVKEMQNITLQGITKYIAKEHKRMLNKLNKK
jgi:hypothetical protein